MLCVLNPNDVMWIYYFADRVSDAEEFGTHQNWHCWNSSMVKALNAPVEGIL